MILLALLACDRPAAVWPADPCRVGALFADVTADVRCASDGADIDASFVTERVTRVGAVAGEAFEGLSFYATGEVEGGGTLSVGLRSGAVGVYARDTTRDVVVGFLPASADLPAAPHAVVTEGAATCDAVRGAGGVAVTGLPDDWSADGGWEMTFDAGSFEADEAATSWAAPWADDCPLSPAAWASVRVSAACDGEERAAIEFLAPSGYAVELDALGQVAAASATWDSAFSATCAGGELASLAGSIQAEDGVVRLYTPVLTVARREDGAWTLEETACGSCDAWAITVDGLPGF